MTENLGFVKKLNRLRAYKRGAVLGVIMAFIGMIFFVILGFRIVSQLSSNTDYKPEVQLLMKLDNLSKLGAGLFFFEVGLFLLLIGFICLNAYYMFSISEENSRLADERSR